MQDTNGSSNWRSTLRWWPAAAIGGLSAVAFTVIRMREGSTFQEKNMQSIALLGGTFILLLLWWCFFSRIPWRQRIRGIALVGMIVTATLLVVRIEGVSGDLLPILSFRWKSAPPIPEVAAVTTPAETTSPDSDTDSDSAPSIAEDSSHPAYPQFLGADRTAILPDVRLDPDWATRPPAIVWRKPIGAAWSGFVVHDGYAFTQEQLGKEECVTCIDIATGEILWRHTDLARYATTIAGEGPRATPTLYDGNIYTLGATGILNCLEMKFGIHVWSVDLQANLGASVPEWGFSGSPFVDDNRVYVIAGAGEGKAVAAYDRRTGERVWTGGNSGAAFSSLVQADISGKAQLLAFNRRALEGLDLQDGTLLWSHPFGKGQPHVATPLVFPQGQVLISAGYGVGAELIEVTSPSDGNWEVREVWKSIRMKAKFANLVTRDGAVYGLDDGILAAIDVESGDLLWKEGRYGHGQGLLVGDHYLLMAESGELVLLQLTREKPNELGRFRIFRDKTWNPIALSGDRLLVRNDREAAHVRLPLAR